MAQVFTMKGGTTMPQTYRNPDTVSSFQACSSTVANPLNAPGQSRSYAAQPAPVVHGHRCTVAPETQVCLFCHRLGLRVAGGSDFPQT